MRIAARAWPSGRWSRGRVVAVPALVILAIGGAALWWTSPDGPRARGVHATSSCPSQPAADAMGAGSGAGPPRAGSRERMVPVLPVPVGPVRTTVCRYAPAGGATTGALRLVASARLDAARTAEAAGWLDTAVSAVPARVCPAGTAAVDVLTFGYPQGPDVVVTIRRLGCGTVSNGVLERRPGRALIRALDGLVP